MCGKCSNNSCSGCNADSYSPNSSSALKYDGPKFVCPGNFTINPGDSLNDTLAILMGAACNASGLGGNFGIIIPILENLSGFNVNLPAGIPVNEYIQRILIDRNSCSEDVVATWVGLPVEIVQVPLDPVLFPSNASTIVLPWSTGNAPVITVPVGLPAGTYPATLRLSSATCGTVDLPCEIIAS